MMIFISRWWGMSEKAIYQLRQYLMMPKIIELLAKKIEYVHKNYYATHSLIGTAQFDKYEECQKAKPIDLYVAEIISEENALDTQRKRLIYRYSLFSEELSQIEQEALRSDLYADFELLEKALNWIEEIEFFLDEHIKQKKMQLLNDFEMDSEKIDELNDEENELFELFEMFDI